MEIQKKLPVGALEGWSLGPLLCMVLTVPESREWWRPKDGWMGLAAEDGNLSQVKAVIALEVE